VDRPTPEQYQPRLTWWGHLWRTALVVTISTVVWLSVAEGQGEALFVIDLSLGVLALALSFYRRRWPMTVAVLTALMSAVSATAAGPSSLAAVSVATRRRWGQILPLAALTFAASQVFALLQPVEDEPLALTVGFNLLVVAAFMAWGMYIGSRRELLWTLRRRAERAEAEQELRVAQARSHEQARIAREMHDVLAHRISQISMHAGALAFREDLTADEMRSSAAVIQEKAHEALTDLRGVLGVLRDADGDLALAPQPTYDDIEALVLEARESGMNVTFRDALPDDEPMPEAVGRTVYRIVQEGLTNARKHAPGTAFVINLRGNAEEGVDVVLSNPLGFGASSTPGSGLGLVGLAERAELRGGHLRHGREGSSWVLRAWIPWAA
jgi:signal transduction histidine kinase